MQVFQPFKNITPRQVLSVSLNFYPLLLIGYVAGHNGLARLGAGLGGPGTLLHLFVALLALASAIGLFYGRAIFWHSALGACSLFLLMGLTFVRQAYGAGSDTAMPLLWGLYVLLPIVALVTLVCMRHALIRRP